MSGPLMRCSGDVEVVYEKIAGIGFVWERLVKLLPILGIDDIILAPSKSKLVYIPLKMSTSERAVASVFKPRVAEIVVDIGAWIGRYTLTSSNYVGPSGKVISIEAHPGNFQILKKNLILNKRQNVIPLNIAVSNYEGRIKLYMASSSGWHSINPRVARYGKYIEVPCKTLDNVLKELSISKVDWIKIDVEGAELMVLEGSQETLAQNKNLKIILEVTSSNEKAVLSILKRLNYTVRKLDSYGNYYACITL
jgi:FkbM family methyltransferase